MTANTGTVRNPAERRRRLFAVFLIGMVEVMFVLLVAAVVADVSGISGSAPAFAYDSRAYDDAAIRLLQTVRWRPAMASPPVRCCSACAVTAT